MKALQERVTALESKLSSVLYLALALISICLRRYLGTAEQKSRADAHQAELKKERDEVSRLKAELDRSRDRTAELEKSAAEEKQPRDKETRKLKESIEESESRATSAEGEAQALKTKIRRWVAEFSTINGEMDSKSFPFLLSSDIHYLPPYNLFWW